MDWLVWILFESTAALGIALVTVLFILLVLWRRGGQPKPLLVGLIASIVLLSVQALVTTKREHAGRALDAIEADLAESRADALAEALADTFNAGQLGARPLDRDRFIRFVQKQLARIEIRWVDRRRLRIDSAGPDQFVVTAQYLAQITSADFAHALTSGWQITFGRTPDGWKITRIDCVHIGGAPDQSWGDINRM